MSFSSSLRQFIGTGFCYVSQNSLAALRAVAAYQNRVNDWTGFTGPLDLDRVVPPANAIHRNICNNEPPALPPPPFEGGQCDCRTYDVAVQVQRYNGDGSADIVTLGFPIFGPIRDIFLLVNGGPNPFKVSTVFIESKGGDFGQNCPDNVTLGTLGDIGNLGQNQPDPEIVDILITPQDGLPDDCGSPPIQLPPLPPDGDRFILPDFTYINDVDIEVSLGPIEFTLKYIDLDVDFRPRLNFEINLGGAVFNGQFNLDVTNEFEFDVDLDLFPIDIFPPGGGRPDEGFPDPDGPEPGDPFDPTPPPEDPPEEPGDPRLGRRLVGVRVVTTDVDSSRLTVIFQDGGNPDLYVPDLGLVNFYGQLGGEVSGWTEDFRVKNTDQIIKVPNGFNATQVRGTPRPGVTWDLQPLYANYNLPPS